VLLEATGPSTGSTSSRSSAEDSRPGE
jgi:hypothetical protein